MPNHARCAVGYCDNDKRYPELYVKRSHVSELVFHKWPKDVNLAEVWRKQVCKSRADDFNPPPGAQGTFVCSNHFPMGRRTPSDRSTDYPSVFLTISDHLHAATPKKRRKNRAQREATMTTTAKRCLVESADGSTSVLENEPLMETEHQPIERISMRFEQLTRECEVRLYTGLPSTDVFRCLFEHLQPKLLECSFGEEPNKHEKNLLLKGIPDQVV